MPENLPEHLQVGILHFRIVVTPDGNVGVVDLQFRLPDAGDFIEVYQMIKFYPNSRDVIVPRNRPSFKKGEPSLLQSGGLEGSKRIEFEPFSKEKFANLMLASREFRLLSALQRYVRNLSKLRRIGLRDDQIAILKSAIEEVIWKLEEKQ